MPINPLDILKKRYAKSEISKEEYDKMKEDVQQARGMEQELLDIAGVMLMVLDRNGRVTFLNKKGYAVLGYEEGELIGTHWISVCLPLRIRDEMELVWQRLISGEGETVEYYENPVLTKQGEEGIMAWHNAVKRDDAGTVTRVLCSGEDITERKQAQEALRKGEARYRSLFENSFQAILLTSPDGRIFAANPEACRLLGWKEEELVRIGMKGIVDVADPRLAPALRERELTGRVRTEVIFIRKEGTRFEGAVSSVVFEDRNGALKTSMVIRDVTERRKSKEALQESEEKFRLLFEKSIDPVVLMDGDTFVDGNEAALRLMGCSRKDQLMGLRPSDLSPERQPDGRLSLEKSQELIDAALREGVIRFEWMRNTLNGEHVWIDVSLTTIPIRGRRIIYTAWRDISERKKAEEALRESEERYRVAIESSNDGVVITRNGLHVYINRRFLEMFGYGKAEEVLGKPVGDGIHPDDQQRMIEINLKRQAGEIPPSKYEFVGIRSDGSLIHLESSGSTITYDGEPAVLGYLRDITERKQAEAQLRESRERLRALAAHLQAIREEERARVAREIHDELGQALTCMKIDLWQIREESSLGPVDKEAVLLRIERLLGFIDATADTVRRIASDLRPSILDDLGLVPAIEWQLSDFQRRTGIICAFRKPRSLVIDKDYSSVLFRVFQESFTNIARHSEAKKVEITLWKTKEELVLAIRDDGKGIPEREVSNSASLGILGMRERVLPFDGHIHITGRPGKGTRVTVRIPLPGRTTKESQGDAGGAYDQGFDSR